MVSKARPFAKEGNSSCKRACLRDYNYTKVRVLVFSADISKSKEISRLRPINNAAISLQLRRFSKIATMFIRRAHVLSSNELNKKRNKAISKISHTHTHKPYPSTYAMVNDSCAAECFTNYEALFQPTDKHILDSLAYEKRKFQPQWYEQ